ncbi:MAG: hypothetical protein EBX80_03870 [Acidimicrobiia bacterium]|nr:hypothetical protein [Acidimicrobiia bacterium]
MTAISVGFELEDAGQCMPHLKGVTQALALEDIEELFRSYVREAGCEIMWQLLDDAGWNIGGKRFIECGGW